MKGWLYYRIFARDTENWYYKLLNEVVKAFIRQNESLIDKFFFFHYGPRQYDQENDTEMKFKPGEVVRYIRFRIRANTENISALEDELLQILLVSPTVLEKEKGKFDEKADLGNRLGQERIELVVNYLDAFARMVLSLLNEQNQLEDGEKPYSTIHLLHNMLGSTITVTCANSGCGEVNIAPMLTAFKCNKCGVINYF